MFRIVVLAVSDLLIVNGSYVLAYALKFKLGRFYPSAQIEPYLSSLYLLTILWGISLILFKVYDRRRGILSGIEEFLNMGKAGMLATCLVMASTMIFPFIPGSRFVLLYAFLINILLMGMVHHLMFLWGQHSGRSKLKNILIIGTDEVSQSLYERLLRDNRHRYNVIGAVGDAPSKLMYSVEKVFQHMGSFDLIWPLLAKYQIKEVFIATQQLTRQQLSSMLDRMIEEGLEVWMIPSFYDVVSNRVEASDEIGLPLFSIKPNVLAPFQIMQKRVLDIALSLCILIFTSPLLLFISAILRLENKGDIIYKQERVGLNGLSFIMYKFRTMATDVEAQTGPVIHTEEMSYRLSWLGRILRKTSLDEMPQLFNILKGDMSLVGPRPERPFFVEQFRKEIPDYEMRHRVLPGVTGWAQINGRSALSTRVDEKVMYDLYYINNWSLAFDVKILFKTVLEVLTWRGAY
ncbi:MAG: sugar transferase [Candidatus Margulisiibacteriota bacterium]